MKYHIKYYLSCITDFLINLSITMVALAVASILIALAFVVLKKAFIDIF